MNGIGLDVAKEQIAVFQRILLCLCNRAIMVILYIRKGINEKYSSSHFSDDSFDDAEDLFDLITPFDAAAMVVYSFALDAGLIDWQHTAKSPPKKASDSPLRQSSTEYSPENGRFSHIPCQFQIIPDLDNIFNFVSEMETYFRCFHARLCSNTGVSYLLLTIRNLLEDLVSVEDN